MWYNVYICKIILIFRRSIMKRFDLLIKALYAALLCGLLALPTFAEEVILIDGFGAEESAVTWTAGDFVSSARESDGWLEVTGERTDASEIKSVRGDFASPILMDDVRRITARVYAVANRDVDVYFVRIRLFGASGELTESITPISSGEVSEVALDISEWKHKEIVTGIEIGLIPEHTASGVWSGIFHIDDIALHSFTESERAARFLFDEATVSGGEITYAEDGSYFELVPDEDADETVIEFDVDVSSVAFADTLRLNIENYSHSDKMLIAFSDSDSFARDIYTELEQSEDRRIYYIKTGLRSPVRRVRLKVFGKGNIRFNGISLTDGYEGSSYITYGDITSAKLSSDGKQIIIAGEIPREYVTEFEGCELFLYSLGISDDPKEADYDMMPVLARHGMSTKFTFRLDAGKQSGDALFKKYVVKISSSPKVFVDIPVYVSVGDTATLKKGISTGYISPDPSGVADSLCENGIVDISINRLISAGNSGYMQASAGKYYYFDKSYVDLLDSRISALYSSGASVIARLTVDGKELDGLCFDSSGAADSYLINTESENGSAYVRAACEFLLTRYADNRRGNIDSFIIGKAVNSGRDISGAPNMSLTQLVKTYANTMRLVYASAMNVQRDIRVYASVSDVYRNDYVALTNNETDTEIFIRSLGDYIYDEGYFPWGVCVEELGDNGGEHISPTDAASFKSFLADMQTFKGAAAMIISRVNGDGAQELEAFMQAARLGFSGKYVFADTDGSHTGLIRALNTGDREYLESIGINLKTYGELLSSGKIGALKYTRLSALVSKPEKINGSYVYYDFNTHTGIGNFNSSFYARDVRVAEDRRDTPVLLAKIDKSLYGEQTSALLSGVGAVFDTPRSAALTPVMSFDVCVLPTDGSELDRADVVFRLISQNGVCDCTATVGTGEFNTVFIDLGRQSAESFEAVQVLVAPNPAQSLELCVDNITGYSAEYNDGGLKEAIESADQTVNEGGINRDLIAVIITAFAILLTAVASVIIIKGARKNKED